MSGDVGWVGNLDYDIDLSKYKSIHVGNHVAKTEHGKEFMKKAYEMGLTVFALPPGGIIPPEGIKAWSPEDA